MYDLYPLKFSPIFKDKIWGGQRIHSVLGMDFSPLPNCGEAWVVSGYKTDPGIVENGFLAGNELNELIEVYMGELVGEANYERFGNEFPLLIKILDADDWLSIQVHPDDELAGIRGIGSGKTEMWYVMDASPEAQLISGFSQQIGKDIYKKHLENKTLKEVLNFETVNKGDVFFIPSGRVHALGPGVLLAEIQQTSDNTYRIYDWDRVDASGQPRELHIEQALDAIDFTVQKSYRTDYPRVKNVAQPLVECPYFTTNLLDLNLPVARDFSSLDSFVVLLNTEGTVRVEFEGGNEILKPGEALLVPAINEWVRIYPDQSAKILEVYIDPADKRVA
ncbi:MAG: mannose-6-phosphate isomerase [Bacteroidetes bacterium HGW-Bacteroidetes-22]|nr:MAG: mannose-6-phosphate isomerase [Bacteroidetes bacterium HGW-Bacteroidetes-22]